MKRTRNEGGRWADDPSPRWQAGDHILLREVHQGRVWAARPAVVVQDTEELVATYLAPGTRWQRPVARDGGRLRAPEDGWRLEEATWHGSRMLYLITPGAAHSIHLWWLAPDWRFGGWYVNLQEPIRRGPLGFDYLDQLLDIVIEPDLSWRWKDEHEIDEATANGLVTRAWAAAVRREGKRVIARLEGRQSPFSDGWEEWQPDPAWPIPALPAGWDAVDLL